MNMKKYAKYLILWFFELIIMTVLSISSGLYISDILTKSVENVKHTNQVIDQIDKVFIIVLRAENSVKSYIALGNPEYMTYYNELKGEYPYAFTDLRYLIQDNSTQRENLSEFARVIQDKHAFLQNVLKLHGEKRLDVTKQTGLTGKTLMDRISLVYNNMKKEEYRLLNDRTERLENRLWYMTIVIPTLTVLNFVLIILSYFMIRPDHDKENSVPIVS